MTTTTKKNTMGYVMDVRILFPLPKAKIGGIGEVETRAATFTDWLKQAVATVGGVIVAQTGPEIGQARVPIEAAPPLPPATPPEDEPPLPLDHPPVPVPAHLQAGWPATAETDPDLQREDRDEAARLAAEDA
jgi:hypothetical protein